MKKLFITLSILALVATSSNQTMCQTFEYSNAAIALYNAGAALQNQRKYELAEQKYLQALKVQPNFAEARKNLSVIYHNQAINACANNDNQKAIEYAKKSLNYDSKLSGSYNTLAICYSNLNDYEQAIAAFNKVLSFKPNDYSTMQSLAQEYIKANQYSKASEVYNKILQLHPDDSVAKQNLKFASSKIDDCNLKNSLNNVTVVQGEAPASLYRLIKPSAGITNQTVGKMKSILDLIWSEPNGREILKTLIAAKVPINITQGAMNANATKSDKQNTLYLYGFIPIFTYNTSSLAVNIPFNYISDFNDPNLAPYQRIYSLHVFIHEFCHAFRSVKYPQSVNSIEEELGVSMIAYNISYKVITGKYLTYNQTQQYSMACLESLLKDEHRNLPVYSNFKSNMQMLGIQMPYPEAYANLNSMYQELLQERKVYPVANFQYLKN